MCIRDSDDTARIVAVSQVGDGMILDIGPESARAYAAVLRGAKTIVFNGPMGVYEKAAYQNGTRVVGEAIADATRHGATSVVGGGDAAAAAHALGFADAMTHVSTGGGATLEFLEGKTLPGVAALELSLIHIYRPGRSQHQLRARRGDRARRRDGVRRDGDEAARRAVLPRAEPVSYTHLAASATWKLTPSRAGGN